MFISGSASFSRVALSCVLVAWSLVSRLEKMMVGSISVSETPSDARIALSCVLLVRFSAWLENGRSGAGQGVSRADVEMEYHLLEEPS